MSSYCEGRLIGGKYRLQCLLARGGMGEVWQAFHLQLDTAVAIKFMDAQLVASPAACERFLREARAAAAVHSPHVVHISDHGVDGAAPYIVMELLHGEDLDTRLMRGPLPLELADVVMTQAASGLRRAHEAGIVHRDLKPSNLFLVGDDDELVVKIVDFGVAKAARAGRPLPPMPPSRPARDDLTQVGVVLGSPQYMSPEQARGSKNVDHRADVWALASIMFRAVSGTRLFGKADAHQALMRLVYEPLPVPSKIAPHLPPSAGAFFDRALAAEPSMRFGSARELARGFSSAVAIALGRPDPGSAGSIGGAAVSVASPASTSGPGLVAAPMPGATIGAPGAGLGPPSGAMQSAGARRGSGSRRRAVAVAAFVVALLGGGVAAAWLASPASVAPTALRSGVAPAVMLAVNATVLRAAPATRPGPSAAAAPPPSSAPPAAPSASAAVSASAEASGAPAPVRPRRRAWGF